MMDDSRFSMAFFPKAGSVYHTITARVVEVSSC